MIQGRRMIAVFALVVAAAPWLSAGIVAVHLGYHDARGSEDRHQHEAAVAGHGHHHEAGTPEHEHISTLPRDVLSPARIALVPVPAILAHAATEVAASAIRFAVCVGAASHDPPSSPGPFRILRI
jgi:hypothetical protein